MLEEHILKLTNKKKYVITLYLYFLYSSIIWRFTSYQSDPCTLGLPRGDTEVVWNRELLNCGERRICKLFRCKSFYGNVIQRYLVLLLRDVMEIVILRHSISQEISKGFSSPSQMFVFVFYLNIKTITSKNNSEELDISINSTTS